MEIAVITIFPEMFRQVLRTSIIKRAQQKKKLRVRLVDLRRYTHDKRRTVDDAPYGGGPGMVMKVEPMFEALRALQQRLAKRHVRTHVVLLSPAGEPLTQSLARQLAASPHLTLLCGHYEGVDERVRERLVDREISIGDYVLSGGELPAMIVIDAVARLLPGVLGNSASAASDSFADGLLEYPQYTRPVEFEGMRVPEILLSGNHAAITHWRQQAALHKTAQRRPDLLHEAQTYGAQRHKSAG